MLSKILPFVTTAHAGWGFGWSCPDAPLMEDFDSKKFEGLWYEIYRDNDHNIWSNQLCTKSYYSPVAADPDALTLDREFKQKTWFGEPPDRS